MVPPLTQKCEVKTNVLSAVTALLVLAMRMGEDGLLTIHKISNSHQIVYWTYKLLATTPKLMNWKTLLKTGRTCNISFEAKCLSSYWLAHFLYLHTTPLKSRKWLPPIFSKEICANPRNLFTSRKRGITIHSAIFEESKVLVLESWALISSK